MPHDAIEERAGFHLAPLAARLGTLRADLSRQAAMLAELGTCAATAECAGFEKQRVELPRTDREAFRRFVNVGFQRRPADRPRRGPAVRPGVEGGRASLRPYAVLPPPLR